MEAEVAAAERAVAMAETATESPKKGEVAAEIQRAKKTTRRTTCRCWSEVARELPSLKQRESRCPRTTAHWRWTGDRDSEMTSTQWKVSKAASTLKKSGRRLTVASPRGRSH
jgi:hypothetical protein